MYMGVVIVAVCYWLQGKRVWPYLWSFAMAIVQQRTPPTCKTMTTGRHGDPFPGGTQQKDIIRMELLMLDCYFCSWQHLCPERVFQELPDVQRQQTALTLFLWALTEAYRTVPLKPATVLGWTQDEAKLISSYINKLPDNNSLLTYKLHTAAPTNKNII